jgi:ABC-2 type transport system permease protein
MRRIFEAAWVIARRDFVATVFSRTFLLFLFAPLFALAFGMLIGEVSEKSNRAAAQPVVAIIADGDTAAAVRDARDRLASAVGTLALPEFRTVDAEADIPIQSRRLLANGAENVSAVLTGTLAAPALTAPAQVLDKLRGQVSLIVDDARRGAALSDAGMPVTPRALKTVTAAQSAGSLNLVRYRLAQGGQYLILLLTLILAGMMLSNMVEEKSNKVIEVLAAAVPLDAVFLGKLIAMLGVSLVGIIIWGSLAGIGLYLMRDLIGGMVTPAIGWPAYAVLLAVYFAANYMLLGSLFLGIGSQANSMREVQTLTMPVTFFQLAVLFLAGAAVQAERGTIFWLATIFPLSSPLAMIAVAAQSKALWPHLLAIVWQLLWVALLIRVIARRFHRTVLKSGGAGEPFFAFLRRRSA